MFRSLVYHRRMQAFKGRAPLKAAVQCGFCSSPPLRCFSSLIQISISACVSPEDRRCATYQEILSSYANEHSQERERERKEAGVGTCAPKRARAGDLWGWLKARSVGCLVERPVRRAHDVCVVSVPVRPTKSTCMQAKLRSAPPGAVRSPRRCMSNPLNVCDDY